MQRELTDLQPKLAETGRQVAETLVTVDRETREAAAKREVRGLGCCSLGCGCFGVVGSGACGAAIV